MRHEKCRNLIICAVHDAITHAGNVPASKWQSDCHQIHMNNDDVRRSMTSVNGLFRISQTERRALRPLDAIFDAAKKYS